MRAEKITSLIFSFQNLFACYLNQQKVTCKTSHKLLHKTFWSQIMGWSWHKGYIICRIQNKVLHHMLTLFLLSLFFVASLWESARSLLTTHFDIYETQHTFFIAVFWWFHNEKAFTNSVVIRVSQVNE